MMPTNRIQIILLFLLAFIIRSCSNTSDSGEDFGPNSEETITIESDRIVCDFCDGFGTFVEASANQIFVGGLRKIWIFTQTASTTTLTQEIQLGGRLELNSITISGDELLLGLHNEFGDGSVHRYVDSGTRWEFDAIYEKGRALDNFGNDLDLSDTHMVVGASAPWSNSINEGNLDAGSIHVFVRNGQEWSLQQDFNAENSDADDRFGTDVLLVENTILAGGLSIPIHVYQRENMSWTLLRTDPTILPADLAREGNTILYYSEEFGLQSFRLNPDGTFETLSVDPLPNDGYGIDFNRDNISISNGYALFRYLGGTQVFLLKLTNNSWAREGSLRPADETDFEYSGIKLTPELALIGGSDRSNASSYLFIERY